MPRLPLTRWLLPALRDQLPVRRFVRNVINGKLLGLLHPRSHYREDGSAKVAYSTKASALRAATKMQAKHGHYFSRYKCAYCKGYHLGKNRPVQQHPQQVLPLKNSST
jgi:hypothetical protein